MSKGSGRRPGEIKPGVWEAIFGKPEPVDMSIPEPKIDTSAECVDEIDKTDWSAA